jgi:hypothetical protein
VTDITEKGHITCGIIGAAQLFPVLSSTGHHDVAVKLATATNYPSWGWTFNNPYENAHNRLGEIQLRTRWGRLLAQSSDHRHTHPRGR